MGVLSTLNLTKQNAVKYVVTLLIAYFSVRFLRYLKWRNQLLKTFNVPKPSLLLGNLMDFVNAGGFNETFFEGLHAKHGEVAGFFLLPTIFNLSTTNPDLITELYKKTRDRPLETYMFLFYLGPDNLLFTHGPIVKQLRLKYGSMITNKMQLEKLNVVAQEEFGKMLDSFEGKREVDFHHEVGPVIYDVMGRVLFGGGWTNTDRGDTIYKLHKFLIQNVNKYMMMPWLQPLGYSKFKGTMGKWRRIVNTMLDEREQEIKNNPEAWKDDESALTMLLTTKDDQGKPFFTRHRAVSTVCGFLNGAYDTTHATFFWIFYNLASHIDKQDVLRDEIRKVIPKYDPTNPISLDAAREIEYLEAFIRESMRMYSTVPVNQRVNLEEDIVLGGSIHIPKGITVNVPMSLTFRRKEFFGDDVDAFRPERFCAADPFCEKAKRAWSAFGGHSRMCIGTTFAFAEIKAVLAMTVLRYHIRFADENDSFTEKMIEAGVNQPEKKLKFRFIPV